MVGGPRLMAGPCGRRRGLGVAGQRGRGSAILRGRSDRPTLGELARRLAVPKGRQNIIDSQGSPDFIDYTKSFAAGTLDLLVFGNLPQ